MGIQRFLAGLSKRLPLTFLQWAWAGLLLAVSVPSHAQTSDKSLATLLEPVLQQASQRTVHIVLGGTSISAMLNSNNQIFVHQLQAMYGDARTDVESLGSIGGSFDLPINGWLKQPYSGPQFIRMRGDNTSQPLSITSYGSLITVEYSKESDGGTCDVSIDGQVVGTINCSGPQAYGQRAVFPVSAGLHTVTFAPPTKGYAYAERVIFDQGRPGLAILDGTLGGSGLVNVYENFPRAGNTVDGVPTQPGVGVAAWFKRPDTDLVIWSGPVNDTGGNNPDFPTWTAHMDEMVAATRGHCPLILIAEMGGHEAMPADAQNSGFLQKYQYLLKLGQENDHVFTLDWHGATFNPDIQQYAADYYLATNVNPATGAFDGDFIHPTAAGHRIALHLLCASLGLPEPPETNWLDVQNRLRKASPIPTGSPISFLEGNTARQGVALPYGAAAYGGLTYIGTYPLAYDPDVTNLYPDINQQIAASTTSDQYGPYIACPAYAFLPLFENAQIGERVTVTALVKPLILGDSAQFLPLENGMFFGQSLLTDCPVYLSNSEESPIWVTFDYVRGPNQYLLLKGYIYSLTVARTGSQPVTVTAPTFPLSARICTAPAQNIGTASATLRASANPKAGGPLAVSFAYGTDAALAQANVTPATVLPDGNGATMVSQDVAGLIPGSTYYFQARTFLAGDPTPILSQTLKFGAVSNLPLLAAQVAVTPGPFLVNRRTNTLTQTTTLSNQTGQPLAGPVYYVLDGLDAGTLVNATGTTTAVAPLGSPYLLALPAGQSLAAGASLPLVLQFINSGKTPTGYTTRVLAGGTTAP